MTHSGRLAAAAVSSATIADMFSRLVPQLAPTAAAPCSTASATTSAVVVPIIVRVPRSNEKASTNGRSVARRTPSMAAPASIWQNIVSSTSRSTPPSTSASACSA